MNHFRENTKSNGHRHSHAHRDVHVYARTQTKDEKGAPLIQTPNEMYVRGKQLHFKPVKN